MSIYLKGLLVVVSIVLVGLGILYIRFINSAAPCDTITLTGLITPDTFLAVKDCLVQSDAKKKTFVVKESGGGDWASALALGILIHRHGWDVEVEDLCASSCADFIFPAGRVKYLNRDTLLLFHGGPHQENLLAQAREAEQGWAAYGASAEVKNPERARMEGRISIDDKGPQRLEVQEFLEVRPTPDAASLIAQLTRASDDFYEELGVNPLLPTYGQVGRYEPIYKAYKYGGFTYRLDSLRRLGIRDIVIKDGEWHPERNPAYPDVYEVTYP